MLNPRPLNRPATRASTPNSFSTKTEMVCRIGPPPHPQGAAVGSMCAGRPSRAAVAVEDLHDLVLAAQLALLKLLLLEFLFGCKVELAVELCELLFQRQVLVVIALEFRVVQQQRLDQLFVFFL